MSIQGEASLREDASPVFFFVSKGYNIGDAPQKLSKCASNTDEMRIFCSKPEKYRKNG